MIFTEQIEAICVDRQAEFRQSLFEGKSLRPRKGREWTLGDVIYLQGLLKNLTGQLRPFSEDEFATPLSEIFDRAA